MNTHFSVWVIVLVSDQDPVHDLAILVDLMQPPLHVGKALAGRDIVDDYDPVRTAIIGGGDRAESLLRNK